MFEGGGRGGFVIRIRIFFFKESVFFYLKDGRVVCMFGFRVRRIWFAFRFRRLLVVDSARFLVF